MTKAPAQPFQAPPRIRHRVRTATLLTAATLAVVGFFKYDSLFNSPKPATTTQVNTGQSSNVPNQKLPYFAYVCLVGAAYCVSYGMYKGIKGAMQEGKLIQLSKNPDFDYALSKGHLPLANAADSLATTNSYPIRATGSTSKTS